MISIDFARGVGGTAYSPYYVLTAPHQIFLSGEFSLALTHTHQLIDSWIGEPYLFKQARPHWNSRGREIGWPSPFSLLPKKLFAPRCSLAPPIQEFSQSGLPLINSRAGSLGATSLSIRTVVDTYTSQLPKRSSFFEGEFLLARMNRNCDSHQSLLFAFASNNKGRASGARYFVASVVGPIGRTQTRLVSLMFQAPLLPRD